jgi:hypothetical protein
MDTGGGGGDISARGDKFDLNLERHSQPDKTFQGCALVTDTPTLAVVCDLVEHDQSNH